MNQKTIKALDPELKPQFRYSMLAPKWWPTWLMLALLSLFAFVPVKARDAFAAWVGRWLIKQSFIAKRRNIALANISACFPEMREEDKQQLLEDNVVAVCQIALAMGELHVRSKAHLFKRVNLIGKENLLPLLENGEGVILMAPHAYAIDWGGVIWTAMGYTFSSMYNNTKNPIYEWFMARQRTRYVDDPDLLFHRSAGIKPLAQNLRKGIGCYYLPDEDFGAKLSVFTPFFATTKATLPALGTLAKLGRAKVVPIYTAYNAKTAQFDVYVHPALENFPTGNAIDDALRMNQAVEALINESPADYMWTLKLLKTRPEGEPSLYG